MGQAGLAGISWTSGWLRSAKNHDNNFLSQNPKVEAEIVKCVGLLDEIDIKLCELLLINSRLSYDELAGKLGLSINAVHKRVKNLLDLRIIRAFVARPSLIALGAITVWIYGRCESKQLHDTHLRLSRNDCTYWVGYSGGDFLYAGGYLRDMSDLDSYATIVIDETKMKDPTIGIMPTLPKRNETQKLDHLDYEIISSLHRDSRKSLADVSSELHLTARTIRNRLDKMIERQTIDLTIDWYPDASNDIFSVLHLGLTTGEGKMAFSSQLLEDFSPNLLFPIFFVNIPNQLTYFVWTNTMKQLEDLRSRIALTKGIESVTLNVLQIGYSFDTWRDKFPLGEKVNFPKSSMQ